MPVSKNLRYQILRRDNHACRYCWATAPDVVLTVDHVVPVTLGGSDQPDNLVTACRDCNAGKSAAPADAGLVADVAQDALRWAAAMHRAAELAELDRDTRTEIEQAVFAVFSDYQIPSYRGGGTLADSLPGDWFASIETFLRAGLSRGELVDAAYIATSARQVRPDGIWRYFCGVCHRKLDRLQEVARALIDTEDSEPPSRTCADDRPAITPEVRYAAGTYAALTSVCDGERPVLG